MTDPLTGISDNITLLQSQAKSWYDGLIVSAGAPARKAGPRELSVSTSATRLSKTFDYSDDDQLTNSNADEQVDLVEGINNLRGEKGYAITDERHRLTLYGAARYALGLLARPALHLGLRRARGHIPSRHRRSTAPAARVFRCCRATRWRAKWATATS